MSAELVQALEDGGWQPALPASLALGGEHFELQDCLRLLPGKRLTARGRWRGEAVVAKLFLPRAAREHAAELAGHRALAAAGIDTPALLWQGRTDSGLLAVVYRQLAGAVPLSAMLDAPQRDAVLRDCLTLLAAMHTAGLYQSDIHLDNFLWFDGALYVVDNASIKVRPAPLPAKAAQENLAAFLAQFPWREHDALLALLPAYDGAVDAAAVRERVRAQWWTRARRYLHKIYRDCTEVAVERRRDRFAAAKRRLDAAWRERFVTEPDAVMAEGTMLKDGNTATVVRASLEGRPVVIKRFNIKNRRHALSRAWRPSRAWNAWRAAHLLRMAGLATPEPLLLLERRRGPLRGVSYLVTDYVEDAAEMLDVYHRREPTDGEIARVAEIFRLLHELRLCHGDFKAKNLLVSPAGINLLDLDVLHRPRLASRFRRCARKDRQRFLRNWDGRPALRERFERRIDKALGAP